MTTPSILNPRYTAENAFRNAKVDRSGAARKETFTVTVPASTLGTIIGLVPFQTGATFDYDSAIFVDALGGAVSIGYVYDADTVFTNDPDAFVTATSSASASRLAINNKDGLAFKAVDSIGQNGALANGWIVAVVTTATTTPGTISGRIGLVYDQP